MDRSLGVYVHFPYCVTRCPYCDFAVATDRDIPQRRYAQAVLAELDLRLPSGAALEARSMYVGGGTPSLWEPAAVGEVVQAVRRRLRLPADAEITLEANPESCDPGRLRAFRDAGVNRFSIGVQSFDPAVLVKLGRRHGPDVAERAVRAAAALVPNVSIDLIYGARRSSVETARADAQHAAALPVAHVSAYALTLDPEVLAQDVPLARLRRQGRLPLPDDDEVCAQAAALRAALRRGGFRRYEISSFARRGRESVHNQLYWDSRSYLGLGVGAYGCLHERETAAVRWGNHRSPGTYLAAVEAGRVPTAEEERLGPRELHEERVMLALRTRRGLPLVELGRGVEAQVERLVAARFAAIVAGRLVLTSRGLDLHSAVAARLLPEISAGPRAPPPGA